MHALGRIDRQRGDVKVFKNAQRDQRGDALAVGRNFVQRVAAVIDADGFHPVERVRRHVGDGDVAAGLARPRGDFFGEIAFVKRLAFGFGDALQCFGVRERGEFLTRLQGAALRHERLRKSRFVLQQRRLMGPQPCNRRRYHVAVGGVLDRGFKQIGERQLAVFFRHFHPRRHRARHRHRSPAALGHFIAALEVRWRPVGG